LVLFSNSPLPFELITFPFPLFSSSSFTYYAP
jgi:hypothetical protein